MTKEILSITTLRFVAALYVFLFHVHIRWPLAAKDSHLDKILSLGAVGMSLFFIISGFVLANRQAALPAAESLGKYAFNRFTRIYPVYFVVAALTVPWLISTVYAVEATSVKHGFQIALLVATNILLLQAWFPQMFGYWNDGGSWSISAEAFFYAMFPFLAPWFARSSYPRIALAFLVLYLIASLPGLSAVLFPPSLPFQVFYAIPLFRLSEFLIGVIIGTLYARGVLVPWAGMFFVASVAGVVTYALEGPNFGFIFVADNWAIVPLFAILVFSAASMRSGPIYWLATLKPLVYLGRISYSFYSFQLVALLWLISNHEQVIRTLPFLKSNGYLAAALFVAITVAAAISYHLLEEKLRGVLNRRFASKGNQKAPNGVLLASL
jgi:peptidoglycan/LPS O-acetylase OafA/YrhL